MSAGPRMLPWDMPPDEMPVVAGFRFAKFDDGSWWMQRADGPREGEGSQVSNEYLRAAFQKIFADVM